MGPSHSRVALIGQPLKRRHSEVMHNAAFSHFGVDATYELREMTASQLPAFFDEVRGALAADIAAILAAIGLHMILPGRGGEARGEGRAGLHGLLDLASAVQLPSRAGIHDRRGVQRLRRPVESHLRRLRRVVPAGGGEGGGAAAKKRSPGDFALWKSQKPHEDAAWESPWGLGRPGWHIECSAMAEKFLGPEFEIHGGGLDLRFPHHENELAQSRARGYEFAKIWMHNGMLRFTGEKMSKSVGNVVTMEETIPKAGMKMM